MENPAKAGRRTDPEIRFFARNVTRWKRRQLDRFLPFAKAPDHGFMLIDAFLETAFVELEHRHREPQGVTFRNFLRKSQGIHRRQGSACTLG